MSKRHQFRVTVYSPNGGDWRSQVFKDIDRESMMADVRALAAALTSIRSVGEIEIEEWIEGGIGGHWVRRWYGYRTRLGSWNIAPGRSDRILAQFPPTI